MRKNKKLSALADESLKGLVNESFYLRLCAEQEAAAQKENKTEGGVGTGTANRPDASPFKVKLLPRRQLYRRIRNYVALAVSGLACAAVVLTCVFMTQPPILPSDAPSYSFGNEVCEYTTVAEINGKMRGFRLNEADAYLSYYIKDSVSGDLLAREIFWKKQVNDNWLINCDVMISDNKYYDMMLFGNQEQINILGQTVFYHEERTADGGFVKITTIAHFFFGDYTVKMKFEELSVGENFGFEKLFEKIFIFS